MNQKLTLLATKGVLWSGISQFVGQALQFVVSAILARLLLPEDFGVFGIAIIVTGFLTLLNELGLSAAIVQRKEIYQSHLSTAFWINILGGITLCALTFISAPAIANIFNKDSVGPVIKILSFGLVLGAFSTVHRALLTKHLDFKRLAFAGLGGQVVFGVIAIILALRGYGVWAFVAGALLRIAVQSVLLWILERWTPAIQFSFHNLKQLLSFGLNLAGSNAIMYFNSNVDYLLVGKILGTSALGFYTLAYELALLPTKKIASIIGRVTFPSFAIIQDENYRLQRGYLKAVTYISFLTFPLLSGLMVLSPKFIIAVYGAKWIPTILPLQILCVYGMIISVGTMVGSVLKAKGRPDIELKWNVVMTIVKSGVVFIGVQRGIVGVAVAILLLSLLASPILIKITLSLINLKLREYFPPLFPATFGSIIMSVILISYNLLSLQIFDISAIPLIISSVVIGAAIYTITLKLVAPNSVDEILRLCVKILMRR